MKKVLISMMLVLLTLCLFVSCKEVEPKTTYTVYEGEVSGSPVRIIVSSDDVAYFFGLWETPTDYTIYESSSNGSYSNDGYTIKVKGDILTRTEDSSGEGLGDFEKVKGNCVVTFDNEERLTLTINGVTIFKDLPKSN